MTVEVARDLLKTNARHPAPLQKLTDGAEDIFVNTDSFIEGARSLDPVFKRRMFNEE